MIGRKRFDGGSCIMCVTRAPIIMAVSPKIAIFKVLGINNKIANVISRTPIKKWKPSGYFQFLNISITCGLFVNLPTLANMNPKEINTLIIQLNIDLLLFIVFIAKLNKHL